MQNPSPQTTYVRDLPYTGMANGFPGRHVFRIDEKILPGVCIRCWLNIFNIRYSVLSFNMFLQLPNLWGTWSGPICRWCSPPRTGTCWGARWSTWLGLALSQAWGWPAGLMIKKLSVELLFQLFPIYYDLNKTPYFHCWDDQAVNTLCPHPGSTLETPTEQSSTKTELPASCLPSPRPRLSPDTFFYSAKIGTSAAIHSPCLIARLNIRLLAPYCSPFGGRLSTHRKNWHH